MPEMLIPADVEDAVVEELNDQMPGFGFDGNWGTRFPRNRDTSPEFGRVLAVGGVERDLVSDSLTVTLEAFAEDATRAQRMCAFAVARIQTAARSGGAVGGVTCYLVRVVSLPANLPMPSVPDRVRYTATVSIDLRRSVA